MRVLRNFPMLARGALPSTSGWDGDWLLEARIVPPPEGFDEIQREELARLFGRVVGLRLLFIPLAVMVALATAFAEPTRWRMLFLAALLLPLAIFVVAEALRLWRSSAHASTLFWSLLAIMVTQVGVAFATGALESPFTYTFIPLAIMVGLFSSARTHWVLVGLQIAGVWALAALEMRGALPDLKLVAFAGGSRAVRLVPHVVTRAVVLSAVLGLGSRAGRGVRRVFDAMLARALIAQEESLRAHADRAEELTALTAEIAHELKNPLASVKGLSALLAENVPLGKGAERLGVLRREVDRMRGILDEFLNFSRPLVPLALGRVDLGALAREVAALHEGMAHERGLRIHVREAPADVRCDRRKLRQVLINLVQNALDASPAGALVDIEVPAADGSVSLVRVLDRGAGLQPTMLSRAFEPGVTSKARGSGLGLTIARTLARQQGGEVELREREGGGCVAVVRIPSWPEAIR